MADLKQRVFVAVVQEQAKLVGQWNQTLHERR